MHQISDDWDGFIIPHLDLWTERIKDSPVIRFSGKKIHVKVLLLTSFNLSFFIVPLTATTLNFGILDPSVPSVRWVLSRDTNV